MSSATREGCFATSPRAELDPDQFATMEATVKTLHMDVNIVGSKVDRLEKKMSSVFSVASMEMLLKKSLEEILSNQLDFKSCAGDTQSVRDALMLLKAEQASLVKELQNGNIKERSEQTMPIDAEVCGDNPGVIGPDKVCLEPIAEHDAKEGVEEEVLKIAKDDVKKVVKEEAVEEATVRRSWLHKCVEGTVFEVTFGILIVLNTLMMCTEAEYRGWGTGYNLQLSGARATTSSGDLFFKIIEISFGAVFTLEVVLKMIVERCNFWRSAWNDFDFCIITVAWADMALNLDFLPINPMLLRLVRLVRLVRLTRSFAQYEIFDNLNLMVRGIKAAIPVLAWVFVMLFPLLASFALGMNYTLADFIQDDTKPLETRTKCYKFYGTFSKSFLSMFEVTFASWVPICRFLVENVDEKFAIFFMVYRLVVGIAVLRIVYGVFLHVTFACAKSDEKTLIAQQVRDTKKFTKKMSSIFHHMDTSGDGLLSREEFRDVVQDDYLQTWLAAHDLEIRNADQVFDMSDGGTGEISAPQMVHAFSHMQGGARSIDVLVLLSELRKSLNKSPALF